MVFSGDAYMTDTKSDQYTMLPGQNYRVFYRNADKDSVFEVWTTGTYSGAGYDVSGTSVYYNEDGYRSFTVNGGGYTDISTNDDSVVCSISDAIEIVPIDHPALAKYLLKSGEECSISNIDADNYYSVKTVGHYNAKIYYANGELWHDSDNTYTKSNFLVWEKGYTVITPVINSGECYLYIPYEWVDILTVTDSSGNNLQISSMGDDTPAPDYEYLYNVSDPADALTLPTQLLESVTDTKSAIQAVNELTNIMTSEQKVSPIGIDLATLYAETASAKVASLTIDSSTITINASTIRGLDESASQANRGVESALVSGGINTVRTLSNTITFMTSASDISIQIDPDALTTNVDKVRVETPSYAIIFRLVDIEPDLTHSLTFTAQDIGTGYAAGSSSGKATVKVSLPNGRTSNSITVSLPSDNGDTTYQAVVSTDGQATASKYNPATTTMDGKINTSGTYTVKSNEKDFTDIANKSAEMQRAIRYLASKGIINGTTPTTFSPDGSINRAEIATLLVKALGKLDSTATASFSDVTKGNWFYTAAASSQRHKLINGYEDNTFRGTTNINKVQIVAVSSRVLTSEMNYKTPSNPSSYLGKYSDSIATWAQPEVALATKENLVVYRTDGTFSGDKNMTRGNAAIIIYRLFQRIW